MRPQVIEAIVAQHVDDAASLREQRSSLVRARNVGMPELARIDARLQAHLDGIEAAGEGGARLSLQALEHPGVGEVFVAGYGAIRRRDLAAVDRLLALAESMPEAARAMASLTGWLDQEALRGIVASWLSRAGATPRLLGITACALHRIDPGPALQREIAASDVPLRRRALQAAGELARADLIGECLEAVADADPDVRWQGARSAVLLGDRTAALTALQEQALKRKGHTRRAAAAIVVQALPLAAARDWVRTIAASAGNSRLVIEATGWLGDASAVPWLMRQMSDEQSSRIAADAFGAITGADFVGLGLERPPPPRQVADAGGGVDSPAVAVDADDDLPWPDVGKVDRWWRLNQAGFVVGQRSLLGAPPSIEHLVRVLKTGAQHRRGLASTWRSLQRPGTPTFNLAGPAWRQRRSLASLIGTA